MTSQSRKTHNHAQQGFTLLELLIAMVIMLAVVVGVQMYIAGVLVDQENISERHDQNTQLRIVLSNLQRDIAHAGAFPWSAQGANAPAFAADEMNQLGVRLNAVGGITITSVQTNDSKDCNGRYDNYANKYRSAGWVMVRNDYDLKEDSSKNLAIRCDGSGDTDGDHFAQVNDVVSMRFTLTGIDINGNITNNPAPNEVRLVSLCVVKKETAIRAANIQTAATDCDNHNLPVIQGIRLVRTYIDMPVYSYSFAAGS